jgi:hypothetical protein
MNFRVAGKVRVRRIILPASEGKERKERKGKRKGKKGKGKGKGMKRKGKGKRNHRKLSGQDLLKTMTKGSFSNFALNLILLD